MEQMDRKIKYNLEAFMVALNFGWKQKGPFCLLAEQQKRKSIQIGS